MALRVRKTGVKALTWNWTQGFRDGSTAESRQQSQLESAALTRTAPGAWETIHYMEGSLNAAPAATVTDSWPHLRRESEAPLQPQKSQSSPRKLPSEESLLQHGSMRRCSVLCVPCSHLGPNQTGSLWSTEWKYYLLHVQQRAPTA